MYVKIISPGLKRTISVSVLRSTLEISVASVLKIMERLVQIVLEFIYCIDGICVPCTNNPSYWRKVLMRLVIGLATTFFTLYTFFKNNKEEVEDKDILLKILTNFSQTIAIILLIDLDLPWPVPTFCHLN